MYHIYKHQITNAQGATVGFIKPIPLTKLQLLGNVASLISTQLLLPRSYASYDATGNEVSRTVTPANFWSSKRTLIVQDTLLPITSEVDTLGRVTHHFMLQGVNCHIDSNYKEEYHLYIGEQCVVQFKKASRGLDVTCYTEDEMLLLLFASLYFTIYQGGIQ